MCDPAVPQDDVGLPVRRVGRGHGFAHGPDATGPPSRRAAAPVAGRGGALRHNRGVSPTRRRPDDAPDGSVDGGHVVDIDVDEEMQGAFLEYAYSVIYSRALPDARDGLKPVQRRILYQMTDMGLRPDRGHVKSARVVGEVMGKLHPHGDTAIYDALVRMAQPFSMRLPLIDGHGNFGSLDDGPAAPRYTEARLAPAAVALTAGLDEDVVDFVDNYDGPLQQPEVLPAAFPNLLVNGATRHRRRAWPPTCRRTTWARSWPRPGTSCATREANAADLMPLRPGAGLPHRRDRRGPGRRRATPTSTGRGSFRIRGRVALEPSPPAASGSWSPSCPTASGPSG